MANREIAGLDPIPSPPQSYVLPVQITDGTLDPGKTTIAQLKTVMAITKGDVGLGNVDNISFNTIMSQSGTLTTKTIDGGSNTITNIPQSAVTGLVTALNNKENLILASKTGHGFGVGWAVYKDVTGVWQRSSALDTSIAQTSDGVIVSVTDANNFVVGRPGTKFNTTGLGLTAGTKYFEAISGSGVNYTSTAPSSVGQVYRELFQTNTANEATVINGVGYEIVAPSGGGGGNYTKLAEGTKAMASSPLDIDLTASFNAYKTIEIELSGIKFDTINKSFWMRMSSDGVTYPSSSAYKYKRREVAVASHSLSAGEIVLGNLTRDTTTDANSVASLTVKIKSHDSGSLRTTLTWEYQGEIWSDGEMILYFGSAERLANETNRYFRFLMETGGGGFSVSSWTAYGKN